ncbi:MAG: methylated-DNA--[protein]-cysteine S-methyltransferase [Prolixibacteraceae bacterium]|nr:methylated-DNA--[protein]-cysteine S-methyltransferase [Prolixibacteraceae bacterium]MBT6763339.1 methylated-DNA--[protein]-cysteine S-methyltransferase [Prolixibacteraceae bacterium]MBT6997891.1 methylated-DNA--[protein]-cysteine S-methyltransferase [Prolixibacteraceae bacterium]MBT7395611.1 methylated-DNA--[protein]-cysteine S-methyltransferase [Prolixibacteraceae bacterium]
MKEKLFYTSIETPIGFLNLVSDSDYLLTIAFSDSPDSSSQILTPILKETIHQLNEYFSGKRKTFDLKINAAGTEFQHKVWGYVKNIVFGKTASYLEIAKQTGSEKNTRAVGLANGKNPIPIIIPCHRIIGSNGKLTGYAGGLERKRWLLQHELKFTKPTNKLF